MLNVPKERDKLLALGFTLLNEHPEGRFAMLARMNKFKHAVSYMEIAHIPKYGERVRQMILTEFEWQKLKDLWEGKHEAEQSIQSSSTDRTNISDTTE